MGKLIFDLSGNKGLVDKFEGDVNGQVNHNLRYQGNQGQLADGVINPLKKSGFISPSNTYTESITSSAIIGSFIYDADNDDVYAAEIGSKIYRLDGTDDISLTEVINSGVDATITDTDLYEVGGKKAIVFATRYKQSVDKFTLGSTTGTKFDTWSTTALNPGFTRGLAYGQGLFVTGVNNSGTLYTSVDTKEWTNTVPTTLTDVNYIGFLNNRWFVCADNGTNRIASSLSLNTTFTTSTAGGTMQFTDGAYGAGVWVLVGPGTGSNHTISSPDAITWTLRATSLDAILGVTFGNSLFVSVGLNGAVFTSTNGTAWTSRVASAANNWSSVAYGAGTFVAVAQNGTGRGMRSADGITWTSITAFDADIMRKVLFKDGYFIAVGDAGAVYKSTDGISWTKLVVPSTINLAHLAYGNGYFAASSTRQLERTLVSASITQSKNGDYNKAAVGFYSLEQDTGISLVNSAPYTVYPTTYTSQRIMWDFNDAYISESTKLGQLIAVGDIPERKIERLRIGLITKLSENVDIKVNVHNGTTPAAAVLYSTVVTLQSTTSPGYKDYYVSFGSQSALTAETVCISIELNNLAATTQQGYIEWVCSPLGGSLYQYGFLFDGTTWNSLSTANVGFDFSVIQSSSSDWTYKYITNKFEIDSNTTTNFIRKADNNNLYWFTDSSIHSINSTDTGGAKGILNRDLIVFPAYLKITDAIDARAKMYIAIQSNTQDLPNSSNNANLIGVYVWDRFSAVTNFRDFVAIPGIKDIKALFVDLNNIVNAICIGNDNFVQLRQYTGNEFKLIKTLGKNSYPTSSRGVSVINNIIYWLAVDGHIYLYGSIEPSGSKEVYKFASIGSNLVDVGGVITADNSNQPNNIIIFTGYKDATTEGIRLYRPYGTAYITGGSLKTKVELLPTLSTIKHIRTLHAPDMRNNMESFEFQNGESKDFTDGTPFTFADILDTEVVAQMKCYMNMQSSPTWTRDITYADLKRGYIEKEWNKNNVNSVQFEIVWSGKTALLGEYQPMYLEVNYLDESRQLGR